MRIHMRMATGILGALWIGGFGLILLTGYLMHHGGKITDKNFPIFLDQINRTFEHYVGLILGFLLGSRKAKNANAKCSGGVFLAAALSLSDGSPWWLTTYSMPQRGTTPFKRR